MDHLDNPARRRETQPSAEHQQIATDSERQRQAWKISIVVSVMRASTTSRISRDGTE
jgi:hypothetical protein